MNIDAELDEIEALVVGIEAGDSMKDRVAKGYAASDRLTTVTSAIVVAGTDAQRDRAKGLISRVFDRVFRSR